jgi:hypothetical protein
MANLANLAEQQAALKGFEQNPDVSGFIRDTISKSYGDLKPEIQTLAQYEDATLPSFYNAFSGYGMGTSAADMDPTAQMARAMSDVARQSAMAQTARGVLDTRRATMEDLIGRWQDTWKTGYGMARDAYGRAFDMVGRDDTLGQQAWNRGQADRTFDYGVSRDAIADQQWEAQMELQRQAAARAGAQNTGYDLSAVLEKYMSQQDPYQLYQSQLDGLYKSGVRTTSQGQSIVPFRTNIKTGQTEYYTK